MCIVDKKCPIALEYQPPNSLCKLIFVLMIPAVFIPIGLCKRFIKNIYIYKLKIYLFKQMSYFLPTTSPKEDILRTTSREKCVYIKAESYFNRSGKHVALLGRAPWLFFGWTNAINAENSTRKLDISTQPVWKICFLIILILILMILVWYFLHPKRLNLTCIDISLERKSS